jgi:deoxycytidine triphosphate deaminase
MHLPNDVAVTCIAYSENLGELRIHYAGFAHPNFGHHGLDKLDKKIGAPLIFEARCHSFKVKIRHKEQFARIEYYKMSEFTEATSKYSNQELKLSAIFADW